ncbi:MAG: ABC transporter, partial [Hyphomicrobiales bacterium]|nr:ABC transporter [Hyphomicrobiales bacterium]
MTDASNLGDRRARPDFSALRALLPYAVRQKGRIALAFLALAAASTATLVVPLAVRGMIDRGFSAGAAGAIDAQFLALLAVAGALALASSSRFYLVTTIGERVVADLRADVFGHLTTLDAAFFDGEKTGELVSRLSADTTQMKAAFGASASVALRNLFMFVGAVGLMVWTSPGLSAWTLAAIPFIVLPLVAFGRSVRGRARAAQDRLADASAFAAENLGATRVMQAFGAERATAARYAAAAEGAYVAARDATKVRAMLTAVVIFISGGSVVAILWLGARDVVAGRMSGGALTQFMLYAVLAASALGELSQVWSEISAAAGAAGRIGELL